MKKMIKSLVLTISLLLFIGAEAKNPLMFCFAPQYLNVEMLKKHLEKIFSHMDDLKLSIITFSVEDDYDQERLFIMIQEENFQEVLEYIRKIDIQWPQTEMEPTFPSYIQPDTTKAITHNNGTIQP